jgi:hypothetical protein
VRSVAFFTALALAGCGASSPAVSPLAVVGAPTPRLGVAGYDTAGMYPQVAGGGIDLRSVNAALRNVVVADQRAYVPQASAARRSLNRDHPPVGDWRGVYWTQVDQKFVSASTVAVSALIYLRDELFHFQPGGEGWLSVTLTVPGARRVTISDLFADPSRGLETFGRAWRAQLRQTTCPDTYREVYGTSASNYRHFALTPRGLAVGVRESGACGPWIATVPYVVVQPYLSDLGKRLVAGVRRPSRCDGCVDELDGDPGRLGPDPIGS